MRKILAILLLPIVLLSNTLEIEAFVLNGTYKEDVIKIYTNTPFEESESTYDVRPETVKFFLFTKENPTQYIELDRTNPRIDNHKGNVVFLIHGWIESRMEQWYEDLKNGFLSRDDETYSVIQVDWSPPATQPYSLSARNTRDVGRLVGEFIVNLSINSQISLKNFLLVGHSLGGQVSGFTGKTIIKKTGKKLPRIIALDPAGPMFVGRSASQRLSSTDAEVVFVIHTNGGTFGYLPSCGTIDFFPNGGSRQPGCIPIIIEEWDGVTAIVPCNHQRSWAYFIEAVFNPNAFNSQKCDNYFKFLLNQCSQETEKMGNLQTVKTGKFYLQTNKREPFSKTY